VAVRQRPARRADDRWWRRNGPVGLSLRPGPPRSGGGFLFNTYPFRITAGQLTNQGNKVLWAVRTPRNDGPLAIVAHPLGASTPEVRETRPADTSPGEIYPDGIDVPIPGC
jgi:hypothetical protein